VNSFFPQQESFVISTEVARPFPQRSFQRAGPRSGEIPLVSQRLASSSTTTALVSSLPLLNFPLTAIYHLAYPIPSFPHQNIALASSAI
jgi:hypothetical protein